MADDPTPDAGWPPRLTVDAARILEVLTGDRFYSTKDAALREAVLNAIDACTRRIAEGDAIQPAISVVFDDGTLSVIIDDNGDGMGREQVSNLFSRIGSSMAQVATEVETVGEFGIGVVSYFLVCDEFVMHSYRGDGEPIGVTFRREMLDGVTPAAAEEPARSERGTTLTLRVRSQELYDLLLERFAHWFRGVTGLTATRTSDGSQVLQGHSVEPVTTVELDLPDWAEAAAIGPPVGFDRWTMLDGSATIDVLYRGVYVETQAFNGLWGMHGTLSVHPKRLKPRLNREGFLDEDLQRDVIPFLNSIHPRVLQAGLATLQPTLDGTDASSWSVNRLVSIWLAIPRTADYAEVVGAWDGIFRSRTLFRRLTANYESDVSLNELVDLPGPLYLAADNLTGTPDIVRSAVRVLRAKGSSVVQGIPRDTAYLSLAPSIGQSTADLLLSHFADELPEIVRVEEVAEGVVAQSVRVGELFSAEPKVALVRLGGDGAPLVVASRELWINLDTEAGRAIVQSVCAENLGRRSLLLACHTHAEQHVATLSGYVKTNDAGADRLGLVTRQFLRGLAT